MYLVCFQRMHKIRFALSAIYAMRRSQIWFIKCQLQSGGEEFMEENKQATIRINQNNLYREEIFSDLMVGAIHQMTPVKPNAELDKQRTVMFIGNTQLITQQGPLPVRFPIEAKNLQQAIEKFPESLDAFIRKMVEEAKELQRKEESRIIMPGSPSVGNIKLP